MYIFLQLCNTRLLILSDWCTLNKNIYSQSLHEMMWVNFIKFAMFSNAFLRYHDISTFQLFIGSYHGKMRNLGNRFAWIQSSYDALHELHRDAILRVLLWLRMLKSEGICTFYWCVIAQSVDWLLSIALDHRFSVMQLEIFGNSTVPWWNCQFFWVKLKFFFYICIIRIDNNNE